MIQLLRRGFGSRGTEERRVVITGMSALTSLATTLEESWQAVLQNKSGVQLLAGQKMGAQMPGEVLEDVFHQKYKMQMDDKFFTLGNYLAMQALENAGLMEEGKWVQDNISSADAQGVMIASYAYYIEKQTEFQNLKRSKLLSGYPFAMQGALALEHGMRGYQANVANGSVGSLKSIGDAWRLIKHGYQDLILAGGIDKCVGSSMDKIYANEGVQCELTDDPAQAVKPFDEKRTGTVMGDGGALLVVENMESALARKAPILCEIVGYDLKAYPGDVNIPNSEGILRVLRKVMQETRWEPEEVCHINCSGSGHFQGDLVEAQAIKRVMGTPLDELISGRIREEYNIDKSKGQGPSLNSFKGSLGHLMEASGATELALTIRGMQENTVAGTTNLHEPLDSWLQFVRHGQHLRKPLKKVIKLNVGFGNSVSGLALVRDPRGY